MCKVPSRKLTWQRAVTEQEQRLPGFIYRFCQVRAGKPVAIWLIDRSALLLKGQNFYYLKTVIMFADISSLLAKNRIYIILYCNISKVYLVILVRMHLPHNRLTRFTLNPVTYKLMGLKVSYPRSSVVQSQLVYGNIR